MPQQCLSFVEEKQGCELSVPGGPEALALLRVGHMKNDISHILKATDPAASVT